MDKSDFFKMYKDLLLSKEGLLEKCGSKDLKTCMVAESIIVQSKDVIKVLEAYLSGILSKEDMVDWVNTVWFNDAFDFEDNEANSIISVFSVLETMDEIGSNVSSSDIINMITCLQKNEEYL